VFLLKNKKALVTGGSRGIGKGIVLALAEQGADVVVNYHSSKKEAEETVQAVEESGVESFSVQADVSVPDQVEKMFNEIKEKWGGLDILVNNAGILKSSSFESMSEEQWDKVIAINLKGQFLCSQQAVGLMKEGGRIINVSSIASGGMGIGFQTAADYTASKGGIIGLSSTMALELAEKGINVNVVAPGLIETDMTEAFSDNKELLKDIPKKRAGKPKDIGAAAAFLASDEADYITGTVLYVDGGRLGS